MAGARAVSSFSFCMLGRCLRRDSDKLPCIQSLSESRLRLAMVPVQAANPANSSPGHARTIVSRTSWHFW